MSFLADPLLPGALRGWSQPHILVEPHLCPSPALAGVKGSQSCQSQVKEGGSQWDKRGHWSPGSSPALLARCLPPPSPAKLLRPGPLAWTCCPGALAPWEPALAPSEKDQPHLEYLCPHVPTSFCLGHFMLESCLPSLHS